MNLFNNYIFNGGAIIKDKYLKSLYNELEKVHYKLEKEPDNTSLINKRISVMKKIKYHLRYNKN